MSNLKIPNLGIFPRETYTNNQNKYHDILQFLIILKFYSQNELKLMFHLVFSQIYLNSQDWFRIDFVKIYNSSNVSKAITICLQQTYLKPSSCTAVPAKSNLFIALNFISVAAISSRLLLSKPCEFVHWRSNSYRLFPHYK